MNLSFDSIVFDLDGTLWDTCSACAIAWNKVLQRNAIPFRPITPEDVRSVAGKPHETCMREVFRGLSEEQLQHLIRETPEEDNLTVRNLGGDLFPGVEKGLRELSSSLPLFIVSNCQSGYIETFLESNGFSQLFKDFECWGNTGKSKSENLSRLIQRNGLRRSLFVGDMESDQKAARECRVPFAHVQYGFGNCENPDYGFSSFRELVSKVV